MTAIVLLNVIGATLIVTAIVSLLAWAIVREHRHHRLAHPKVPQPTARPTSQRLPQQRQWPQQVPAVLGSR